MKAATQRGKPVQAQQSSEVWLLHKRRMSMRGKLHVPYWDVKIVQQAGVKHSQKNKHSRYVVLSAAGFDMCKLKNKISIIIIFTASPVQPQIFWIWYFLHQHTWRGSSDWLGNDIMCKQRTRESCPLIRGLNNNKSIWSCSMYNKPKLLLWPCLTAFLIFVDAKLFTCSSNMQCFPD